MYENVKPPKLQTELEEAKSKTGNSAIRTEILFSALFLHSSATLSFRMIMPANNPFNIKMAQMLDVIYIFLLIL